MTTWLFDLLLSHVDPVIWLIVAGAGIGIYLTSSILVHIPEINLYARLLKPISILAALLGVFMYGGSGAQKIWEERVKLAQEDADKKTAMANQLNEDLNKERAKRSKIRIEYKDKIKTEIKEITKVIDQKCDIDPTVVEILNKAATNPEKRQ